MKQQELADAAGVTRQTISNLERGTVPQEATLLRILDVLGIEVNVNEYSDDTNMWLGIIGGMLEQIPAARRGRAGQAAVTVVATELSNVSGTDDDDLSNKHQTDLALAAHDQEDFSEEQERYNETP